MLVKCPDHLATESIGDRFYTLWICGTTLTQLLPLNFRFAKCFLPRQHYLWRLKGLVAAQMWSGLKVPKGKSDIFWQAQVLSVLLQCSGAFCQTGRKESMFSHKSACNLVPDRLIYLTPETFNKLRVPNLLVEGPRIYLQFAIFLQALTWRNSFGTSVILLSLQLLSLHDPNPF